MSGKPGRYAHLVAYALEHPWAITASMRAVIADVLAHRLAGMEADEGAIALARAERETRTTPALDGGGVAVIPIHGVLAPRINMLSDMSGGATFEGLTGQLHQAVADPNVKTIVFDVDSPGGNVAGATEFAREVMRARSVKPVIAQANHLMASAAYWTMAGATEIVASPSALVGGVGVYAIYDDISAALDSLGIKRDILSAGKFKAEGAGGLGLSAEARDYMQQLIDGAYGRFIGDVAKGRGVTPAAVRKGFGEGRVLEAPTAKTDGLVDRIATLDDTLARVLQAPTGGRPRVALESPPVPTDQERPSLAVTSQEASAASNADDILEFEARVFALRLQRLTQ